MSRRLHRATIALVVPLLFGTVAAACGATEPATAPATTAPSTADAPTTTVHDMAHMTSGEMAAMGSTGTMAPTAAAVEAGLDGCAQHMPGELLSAAEAVVRFDPQMVCLGYVTVTPGTPIQWVNGDVADHRVTILDDDGARLNEFAVGAGATVTTPAAAAGVYRFRLTAIDSFVGTIEVQAP